MRAHTQFSGQWYEVERTFYLMELTAGCTTLELQENERGQTEVVARVINRWTGGETASEGLAIASKKNPSHFQYKVNSVLPSAVARLLPGAGAYQILETDYDNFALLYTCSSLGLFHLGRWFVSDASVQNPNLTCTLPFQISCGCSVVRGKFPSLCGHTSTPSSPGSTSIRTGSSYRKTPTARNTDSNVSKNQSPLNKLYSNSQTKNVFNR